MQTRKNGKIAGTSMEVRKRIMHFLARSQEAFAPIQMAMQSLTLTLVAYDFVAWRGIHPYIAIPAIFLLTLSLILGWGYIFVEKLGLFRAKKAGMVSMDPVQVYAFNPFQEMMLVHWHIPLMESSVKVGESMGLDMHQERDALERVKNWASEGFIPRKDFPEHLLKFYRGTEGHRL